MSDAPTHDAPRPDSERFSAPPPRQPVFNGVPGVVLVLCAVILAVQALDSWSIANDRVFHAVALRWGAVVTGELAERWPPVPWGGFAPYLLHMAVHAGWWHALMNAGALLAFGAGAYRPFGRGPAAAIGFLAFFIVCGIAGAALHAALYDALHQDSYMVGASTAISGVLAGAGWARGGRAGMMRLAAPWLVINLAIAAFGAFADLPIAWAGHIGGLLAGAILYPGFVRAARRLGGAR